MDREWPRNVSSGNAGQLRRGAADHRDRFRVGARRPEVRAWDWQRCALTAVCQLQKWSMANPSSRRTAARPSPWTRVALWGLPAFFLLLVVGFFVAKAAIDAYLRSDGFREF